MQPSEVLKHVYEVSNHMSEAGRRVRVCDYDRVYGFREESPDFSRDQDAGRLFFEYFLWSEQRKY